MNTISRQYKNFATRVYAAMFNQGFIEYTVQNGCPEFYAVPIGGEKVDYVVPHPEFDEACHRIGEKFMADSDKLIAEYETRKSALIECARKLSAAAGQVSDAELKKLYVDYWKVSDNFQPYNMFPHYMERELEPDIAKLFPNDFGLISTIRKPTEHMRMHRMLFESSASEVAQEFGWLNIYAMTEEPFDAAYFEDYKTNLKQEEVQKTFDDMEKNNALFEQFLQKLDPEEKKLCEVAHEFVYMRTDRVDAMKKHVYLLYPFAKYIASKISPDLGVREGSMLLREEVMDILDGKQPVTEQEMIQRGKRDDLIEVFREGQAYFVKDDDLKAKLIDSCKKFFVSGDVAGVSACKGKVQGRVKIYMDATNISNDERDFVMVCKHTSPQDLPWMKKAKAIVTDEGGITCHAAIVSRELNIPCIVGTKNGTTVLKNGDEVEVDADKGIVRILKA
jgi:phosphohistidine swiveling domain-containing protein